MNSTHTHVRDCVRCGKTYVPANAPCPCTVLENRPLGLIHSPEPKPVTLTNQETAKQLAIRFKERAAELGYKGKKRDDASLDYFIGAAVLADLRGNKPLYNYLGTLAALVIAIRGYIGLAEIADGRQ